MPLRLLPFAFFALAVQARAEVTIQVSDVSAEYSDEVTLEAQVLLDGEGMSGQQLSFSVTRADDEGNFRPFVNGGVGVTDSQGNARVNLRLVNGRTGTNTVHELKPERSDDEIWRSFSAGDYQIKAQRTAGDLESATGTLTIRREQAALTLYPVTTVAGQTVRLAMTLADSGDSFTDWDWRNDEATESSKSGVQGRTLSVWIDRNGDQQFYNCTAGGTCVDGHCVQCQSSDDCPGSVCDQGLCVAEAGLNTCTVDDDCAAFFGVQGLHCLGGVCVAETCDYLGEATTDILGRASFEIQTAPDEFGHPSVGKHELMLRAEFGGDAYYAGGASKGDLDVAPAELDLSQVPITITLNNEPITEIGSTDQVAIEVRAYLSDVYGNLYGFSNEPYITQEGDCSSCDDTLCQEIGHPSCLQRLSAADVTFTATNGIFITPMERNTQDGAFMRRWRPAQTGETEVRFTVTVGDLASPPATLSLYDNSGCGCTSSAPLHMLWLMALPVLRRRRRT